VLLRSTVQELPSRVRIQGNEISPLHEPLPTTSTQGILLLGDMPVHRRTPVYALAEHTAPIAPIDTFTATWHGNTTEDGKNTTHQYINDALGGCTWPLRRRLLDPIPVPSEESEDCDGNGDSYDGDDEHDEAQPTDPAGDENTEGQQDFVPQLTNDLHAFNDATNTPSDASIKHWLDAQPSNWIHDQNEILANSDFRICHNEEHDPYTLRMLYLRATAPGRRRSSSVVTMLRIDQRGMTWELDENGCVVWLKREESAGGGLQRGSKIDLDGMTAEQLNGQVLRTPGGRTGELHTMQQKYPKRIQQVSDRVVPQQNTGTRELSNEYAIERSPQQPSSKFRLKRLRIPNPHIDIVENDGVDGAIEQMHDYKITALGERMGRLSLRDKGKLSLEERLARPSLRDKLRKKWSNNW
jgi:hypothetical protein